MGIVGRGCVKNVGRFYTDMVGSFCIRRGCVEVFKYVVEG